jgi:hypothetical protein
MRTSRPLALGVVAVALAACTSGSAASPSSSAGDSGPRIDHPTGAKDLVIRYETVGGFVAPQALLGRYPTISIYGDGTVITEGPQIAIFPGPALPSLVATKISEAGLQKLLQLVFQAGLLGRDGQFDGIGIADAGTAQFTVVAGGARHTTSAYALGESGDGNGLDPAVAAARARLRIFVARLADLRGTLGAELLGPETQYAFTATRLYVGPMDAGGIEPAQRAVDWPLAQPLATFGQVGGGGPGGGGPGALACGVVSGADLETLRPVLGRANQGTPWRSDGKLYSILVRVLLPDESGCPPPQV